MERIEEFSTKELLDELEKRFDHFIFAGRIDKSQVNGQVNKADWQRRYSGDLDVCLGIMHGIEIWISARRWGIKQEDIVDDAGTT